MDVAKSPEGHIMYDVSKIKEVTSGHGKQQKTVSGALGTRQNAEPYVMDVTPDKNISRSSDNINSFF